MNLSEKLGQWIEALESIDAPKPPEPSIARDYPKAWAELQNRRRTFKWIGRVMIGCLLLLIASRSYSSFVLELPRGEFSNFDLLMFAVAGGILIWQLTASHFDCPRCGELFLELNSRGAESILNRSDSRCMHCSLLIGEPGQASEEKSKS